MTFLPIILYSFCQALIVAIFLRSLMALISPEQTNFFTSLIFQITEPVLVPLRRIVPMYGRIDFSPFAAIVILIAIMQLLFRLH